MNKNVILIIGVIAFVMLFAGVFVIFGKDKKSDTNEQSLNQIESQQPTENTPTKNDMDESDITQTQEGDYIISSQDSEVSYVVQKKFLQKPTEEVVGTTTNVTGSGSYDQDTGEFELNANVDLSQLSTGSSGRDSEVVELFTPNTATVQISSDNNPNFEPSDTEQEVMANITINETTLELPLTTVITIDESTISAQGETTFNMSDFGINPPSAAGIYTVDDQTVVQFTIVGQK